MDMTAQDLLFYLIRGFADKTITSDTIITMDYDIGNGEYCQQIEKVGYSNELRMLNYKSGE